MRQRIDHLHQMIVGYVIGERNLADRTKALVVERQVDQDPERIIGIAREPHTPLTRGTLGAVCIKRIQIMAHARWTKPLNAEGVISPRRAILRKRWSWLQNNSTRWRYWENLKTLGE